MLRHDHRREPEFSIFIAIDLEGVPVLIGVKYLLFRIDRDSYFHISSPVLLRYIDLPVEDKPELLGSSPAHLIALDWLYEYVHTRYRSGRPMDRECFAGILGILRA